MRRALPLVPWFLLVVLAAAPAAAQTGGAPANPHGNDDLDCASCHAEAVGPGDEVGREFDHSTTGFALEGAHARALCRDCHDDPAFNRVGTACADCHADAHRGRLGPACDECHTPAAWLDRADLRRRHDATALPLVGAHAAVDCDACHGDPVGSQYVGTPTDCYACHAATWAATVNPPHASSGFGTDCAGCHGVYATGWSGGDFRHPSSFPLTGGHALPECSACHGGGFANTPTDCAACHQGDYDRTTDPGHAAAGFPVACATCHTTTAWEPSTWNHDPLFPIYSGRHRGEWNTCADCHVAPTNYAVFECIFCHEHSQAETDPRHDDVNGYQYLSSECFRCHPRGEAD